MKLTAAELDATTATLLEQGDWSKAPIQQAQEYARAVVGEWDITNRQQQFLNSIDRFTSSERLFIAVWNTTQSGWEKKNLI